MQKWHCCSQNKSIVRVRPGIYRLFCQKEHKVTQELSCVCAVVHHMITNTCFMRHDKREDSIGVDEWMAQNLWNFCRPSRGWRDVLLNIWKHLTLLVFCVSACHVCVGKNPGNDEGNGEMAIASLGGFSSGHRPAGWSSAGPGLIYTWNVHWF